MGGALGPRGRGQLHEGCGVRALSLFSGAGGLDLGVEAAGFETVGAVEFDAAAQATLFANRETFFPMLSLDAVLGDITSLEWSRAAAMLARFPMLPT